MNYRRFIKDEQSMLRIMFSLTLGWFYGSIFVLTLIYIYFVFRKIIKICNMKGYEKYRAY